MAVCILLLGLSGCGRLNPQSEAESKFALHIISWIKDYDIISTNTPVTNLTQVFSVLNDGYPFGQHQEFSRFGKRAGFSNSLAEKYVFYWPRFSHRHVEGEVICMSAQPFARDSALLGRIYIARSGSNYIYRMLPEMTVQAVLKEAKPSVVPLGAVQRPPTPSAQVQEWLKPTLSQRYDRFVRDLSGALDQDSHDLVRFGLPVIALLVFGVLTWVCILLWRRSR